MVVTLTPSIALSLFRYGCVYLTARIVPTRRRKVASRVFLEQALRESGLSL
jgi:hypothetical protein